MSKIGRIEISPEVVIDIALESIKEVDGVVGIADRPNKIEAMNLIKKVTKILSNKYIDVELGETECVIDLGLIIKYGVNVVETVEKYQNTVKENVEKLTGINVNEVNVKVSNIVKTEGENNV